MATLEERVQKLEDIRACEQLMYQYEYYLDHGYQGDGIASLFVENGLWKITGVGGTARGFEAIKKHAKGLGAAIPWGQHFMGVPQVTVHDDGKTAEGRFRLLCTINMIVDGVEDAYILIGDYKNTYEKVDGEWKFVELTGDIQKSAPWDKGWVKASVTKEDF